MLRHIKYSFAFLFIAFLMAIIAAASIYYVLAPQLPPTESLKEIQLQTPLRIFSAENKLIAEFGDKRRIPVQYEAIPLQVIQGFLASEDDRFFEHPGVDYQGLLRAAYSLVMTGQKAQGGSTITMQLARNFFLSTEKTYLRKLNEIILAIQIEQVLSKEEILTLYLNKIYLGKRAYGIGAAANVYYGKTLQELTIAEAAMIAGLPKAPSKFNPIANPERALQRRNYVLRRMWEVGYITEQDYNEATILPITARYHSREIEVYAPYVAEIIRTQLTEQYGDDVYNMGLNVYTTIRAKHQRAANTALQKTLISYDHRHGYRGPLKQIKLPETTTEDTYEAHLTENSNIGPLHPGLVLKINKEAASVYIKDKGLTDIPFKSVAWARKQLSTNSMGKKPRKVADVFSTGDITYFYQNNEGEWQLAQLPEAEGALIALEPEDGAVTALNGGFEFYNSKFNRVTQSRRQPGSSFKPFIYSAALEKGYTPASIINDAPVVLDDPSLENTWRPSNYSGKFYGPTRLRVALTHSRNLVSIRLLRDITAPFATDYAARFGFESEQMPRNLSLALGSGSAAPWDMARAYAALANGGYRIEPYLIKHIEDADGTTLMQAVPDTVCPYCLTDNTTSKQELETQRPAAQRIMTPQNAYIMNSLLRDVVKYGTGRDAMRIGRNDLAGKTGTTNDQVDAWFNGFNPKLVAISWVGFDSPRSLGRYETGGRAALPMWIDFMQAALEGTPEEPLELPNDMVTVKIDPETGLLARAGSGGINETFRIEYAPQEYSEAINTTHQENGTVVEPLIGLF
ncbi:MAG: penicillin-binding protein 1A [Piscirickettsiaceae bacterium]|nr:penicillin-binding protein 1A [Piscirickettsiaceae bacterium]